MGSCLEVHGQPGTSSTRGLGLPVRIREAGLEGSLSGVIDDFVADEVTVSVQDPIAEGVLVRADLDGFTFHAEVLLCRKSGDHYEAHLLLKNFSDMGLRRGPRFPVNLPATVYAPELSRPMAARIVDISGYGVGIELAEPLTVEGVVVVRSEANTALGTVRHCRKLQAGLFRAGIELHHTVDKDQDEMRAARQPG